MKIKNVAYIFYAAVAILVFLLLSQAKVQVDLLVSSDQAEINQKQVEAIDELMVQILNIETGARGYVLTHSSQYLTPYLEARKHIEKQTAKINELFSEDEIETYQIEKLLRHTQKRVEIAQTLVRSMPSGARLLSLLEEGKVQMDQIRSLTMQITGRKGKIREEAIVQNKIYTESLIWVTIITSLAIFIFMLVTAKQVRSEIEMRTKTEYDLKINLSYLSSLTSSIPSGIVAINKDGRVTFANNRSSELLSFNPERVQGQYFTNLAGFSPQLRKDFDDSLSHGDSFEKEITIGNQGVRFPTNLRMVPLHQGEELIGAVVTFQDISSQKVLQAELVAEKETAILASKAKSEFLSQMSHEFRTPLNAIIGMGDMLIQSPLNEDQKQYASVLSGAAQNLLRLINDVLDLSKIEAGKLELDIEPFNIVSIVEECVRIISFKASEKNIDVQFHDHLTHQAFLGDAHRLRQVCLNLLSNALKFTDAGKITIDLSEERGMIKIEVTDTGKGIAKDKLESIFEKYAQENAGITKKYGGTGLGLSISREIANLMGGNITAHSIPGHGSTFVFTMRLKSYSGEIQHMDLAEIRLSPMKILLVDDNPDNRLVVVSYLKSHPIDIIEATDGEEAVKIAKREKFDLILMDMHMPKVDGFEATRQIKAAGIETPIIALTAYALKEEVDKILQVGCEERLSKPITRNQLLNFMIRFETDHEIKGKIPEIADQIDSEILDLIPQYLDRRKAEIEKIENWIKNKDIPSLRGLAHNLKGTALSYGQKDLDTWAHDLSDALKDENWTKISELHQSYKKILG
ncbi:MAG: response regulator [Bacteriovoracaceae bacterium]|nr:response regulator [Bacteriovoracaceae bacterium]